MTYITTEVEVKGCLFEIEVEGIVTSGGSSSWGSDEPPWVEVEIKDITGPEGRKISNRLYNAIINQCEDNLCELIVEEDEQW